MFEQLDHVFFAANCRTHQCASLFEFNERRCGCSDWLERVVVAASWDSNHEATFVVAELVFGDDCCVHIGLLISNESQNKSAAVSP